MKGFLEKNLGQPIIDEFILFELGGLDKEEFISKYDFDYFVLKNTDVNIDYFNKHYTGYPVNEDLIIFKIKQENHPVLSGSLYLNYSIYEDSKCQSLDVSYFCTSSSSQLLFDVSIYHFPFSYSIQP